VLRSLATTITLAGLYYLLPLDHLANVPLAVILAVGLLVLSAVTGWQLRLVVTARCPAVRTGEALATTVPLFLPLFVSVYFAMARASPANFSTHSLTRTDSLYFTVTTFSTVGSGNITATSRAARLLVTAQMTLGLLVLGPASVRSPQQCNSPQQERPDHADPAAAPEQPWQQPR
jgi:voltage-gated potassium channel